MSRSSQAAVDHLRSLNREELNAFLENAGDSLTEDEALAVLDNRFCSSQFVQQIAQSTRLTSFYSIRARLVAHRATPQGHALKFVHHLQLRDMLLYSTDTRIAPQIRRAIDTQLLTRLAKMSLGERIAAAKVSSRDLLRKLIYDADHKVFETTLINPRLTEDDLVIFIDSGKATSENLAAIADNAKWSFRYPIRRSLAMNSETPRAIAAAQLRYLQRDDLQRLLRRPETSVYREDGRGVARAGRPRSGGRAGRAPQCGRAGRAPVCGRAGRAPPRGSRAFASRSFADARPGSAHLRGCSLPLTSRESGRAEG